MDFFGIGAPELVLILLIFFIFFGPTKLPEIAGMMGKAMRKIKQASAEMNKNLQEMSDEIKETTKETQSGVSGDKGLLKELQDVSKELGDAAKDISDSTRVTSGISKDLREVSKEITSVARETTVPEPKQGEAANNPGKENQT
jgi:sec-independent protein translocase protein TatA